jgi:hypothetical protein
MLGDLEEHLAGTNTLAYFGFALAMKKKGIKP